MAELAAAWGGGKKKEKNQFSILDNTLQTAVRAPYFLSRTINRLTWCALCQHSGRTASAGETTEHSNKSLSCLFGLSWQAGGTQREKLTTKRERQALPSGIRLCAHLHAVRLPDSSSGVRGWQCSQQLLVGSQGYLMQQPLETNSRALSKAF